MSHPGAAVGLTEDEYRTLGRILGREPNYLELGMFGVMWSEHCSYKSSRPVLDLFPRQAPWVLQGPGENAGVVDIGDGLAVVFKMESHNHPSAVEPVQGAATGIGGIVRDVFAMGARPICLLDALRFGSLDDPRVRYLFGGVVSGISWYGNCIGVPTVGGEVYFDPAYVANPLVNVMCVGLIEKEKLARGVAGEAGNTVMLIGARTGRDGIHGASFASEELSEASLARRPAVQVGDPFKEKLLIEACLELVEKGCLVGLQDLGAAGLTSAGSEMAGRAGTGMEIDVAKVPRRETGMTPYEVMISESQERMLAIPRPGREEEVAAILAKWGLESSIIGRVTGDGMFRILEEGENVAEVPVAALTSYPKIEVRGEKWERRSEAGSQRQDLVGNWLTQSSKSKCTPLPASFSSSDGAATGGVGVWPEPEDYAEVLLQLLDAPTIASKQWVWQQYDHLVQVNTVVMPGAADAAVLRVKGTSKGLAVTTDGNGRYVYLDPYRGGMLAVAEAARNIACVGARPLAVTDCLNFGHPGRPEVFWQFTEAVRGMAEACRVLETPVVSGNVSFYNETAGRAIYPTPVVGMVGLLEDLTCRRTLAWPAEDAVIVLLGETYDELGGSEYLSLLYRALGDQPPAVDLEREKALIATLLEATTSGILAAAHDCSEGGIAVTIAESCLAVGRGARIEMTSSLPWSSLLFGESQGRAVVAVDEEHWPRLAAMAASHRLPATVIGRVGGEELDWHVNGCRVLAVPVATMRAAWEGAIPRWMS